METVSDFMLWGSKITADGDRSHEMKTLAPWKKGTTEDEMVGWHHRLDGHEFEQAVVMVKKEES